MKMSARGKAMLVASEGIVTSRYKDSVGVWTVGIGHTASAGHPDPAGVRDPLTVGAILMIFERDIEKFEDRVLDAIDVPLEQYEFDALVHFDYNTGGIYRSRTRMLINAGDKAAGGKALMGWLKPPEIHDRREAERDLFLYGRYGPTKTSVWPAKNGRVQWSQGKTIDAMDYFVDVRPTPQPPDTTPYQPTFWETLVQFIRNLFRRRK